MRAVVVLPTPRGPENRYACASRLATSALERVRVTCSCPITSAKIWGRHLRERIWYVMRHEKKEDQGGLRHPGGSPNRCFLPDLAGVEGSCRTGPGLL